MTPNQQNRKASRARTRTSSRARAVPAARQPGEAVPARRAAVPAAAGSTRRPSSSTRRAQPVPVRPAARRSTASSPTALGHPGAPPGHDGLRAGHRRHLRRRLRPDRLVPRQQDAARDHGLGRELQQRVADQDRPDARQGLHDHLHRLHRAVHHRGGRHLRHRGVQGGTSASIAQLGRRGGRTVRPSPRVAPRPARRGGDRVAAAPDPGAGHRGPRRHRRWRSRSAAS